MKSPSTSAAAVAVAALVLLLPLANAELFDEPSPRKVNLEDIEEEHLQHERHSKTAHQTPAIPPPLSKQPAKGHSMKMYTPLTVDAAAEYQKSSPAITPLHQYTTTPARAKPPQHYHQHQRVQPLTDQPSAPPAVYRHAPGYRSETIVYLPSRARGPGSFSHSHQQIDDEQQQTPQQPSPIFYYSHDTGRKPSGGNSFQFQFVPISQTSGGSDEQLRIRQQPTSQKTGEASRTSSGVSYSHESGASSQYVAGNEVREPSEVQHVYSIFDDDKDIEYVKPATSYGPPSFSKPRTVPPKPAPSYGPSQQSPQVFSLQKDIEYAQDDVQRKPAITYGPPAGVGENLKIQYGDPDAPFRRPLSQSNQNAYAPRRPETSPEIEDKPFAVSFPYPPSFVSITTARPYYEKSPTTTEPSYNEVSQWQAPNVMPLHLIPPQDTEYRSYSNSVSSIQGPTPAPPVAEIPSTPLIDFFHNRRAKSLLESYIPSWLVAKMQEEHARHFQQHSYVLPSPQPQETGYNTIAYSTHFENIYPKNFKRSIREAAEAD